MIRVAIADDHEIFREGLAQLFHASDEVELVGQAKDGDSLLELVQQQIVDIAIVDISMPGPGVSGICQQFEVLGLETKVVVLTMHQDARRAYQLIADGASGYVLKRNAFAELREALSAILRGETFVSQLLTNELAELMSGRTQTLSARELEVVRHVAQGDTNARIAATLDISIKTVQTHRARAMEKLDVHSAAELVRKLSELGLLMTPD